MRLQFCKPRRCVIVRNCAQADQVATVRRDVMRLWAEHMSSCIRPSATRSCKTYGVALSLRQAACTSKLSRCTQRKRLLLFVQLQHPSRRTAWFLCLEGRQTGSAGAPLLDFACSPLSEAKLLGVMRAVGQYARRSHCIGGPPTPATPHASTFCKRASTAPDQASSSSSDSSASLNESSSSE